MARRLGPLLTALALLGGCRSSAQSEPAPASSAPSAATRADDRGTARNDAPPDEGDRALAPSGTSAPGVPRPSGISHADLMRMQLGVDASAPPVEVQADEGGLPADEGFTGERPVRVERVRYVITLPDEHATLSTERALRVDDQGDRANAMVVGTGLPIVPGMRVAARAGYAGFVLTSPEGARYRVASPDELQRWFLGDPAAPSTALAPTELAALPGAHNPEDILTVDNVLTREALIFLDDLAIGWLAPGGHAAFVGLSAGTHAVRGRALDGLERSRVTTTALPATVRIELPPRAPR
jgi:hypothetical protein